MLSSFASLSTPIDDEIANAIAAEVTYANIPAKRVSPIICQECGRDIDLSIHPNFLVIRYCLESEKQAHQNRPNMCIFNLRSYLLAYQLTNSRFNESIQSRF